MHGKFSFSIQLFPDFSSSWCKRFNFQCTSDVIQLLFSDYLSKPNRPLRSIYRPLNHKCIRLPVYQNLKHIDQVHVTTWKLNKLKSHINSYIPFINWCHLIAPQGFTDLLGNQEETNLQLTDYFLKKYLHSCILINCKLQCITTVS